MKNNKFVVAAMLLLGIGAGYYLVAKAKQKSSKGCGCSDCNQSNAIGPSRPDQNCAVCKSSLDGSTYHTGDDRNCRKGDTCATRYSFPRTSIEA